MGLINTKEIVWGQATDNFIYVGSEIIDNEGPALLHAAGRNFINDIVLFDDPSTHIETLMIHDAISTTSKV